MTLKFQWGVYCQETLFLDYKFKFKREQKTSSSGFQGLKSSIFNPAFSADLKTFLFFLSQCYCILLGVVLFCFLFLVF